LTADSWKKHYSKWKLLGAARTWHTDRENQRQAQYTNGQVFQYIRQFFCFLNTDYKCLVVTDGKFCESSTNNVPLLMCYTACLPNTI